MALTNDDILAQLQSLFSGGSGSQTFGAGSDSMNGLSFSGGANNSPLSMFGSGGSADNGLGLNFGTGKLALSGLASLGNLYGAFQANNLAKDQLKFTKDVANTNLNNQIQSYNTALSDRATARGVAQGDDPASVQSYIDKNRLSR